MPAEKVVGRKCHDLLKKACGDRDRCPMRQIVSGERMVEQEKNLTFSGKTIPFMITSTPLSSLDASTIGLVETFTDITERKNAEAKLQLANRELEAANRELERLATEDGLTALSNRRHFDACLGKEWRRLARENEPISLIMTDVDFFKRYNDYYGHQAGDACLKSVAEVVQKRMRRAGDLCARYGGEEFAVILPATDLEGGMHVAEMIRQDLARLRIPHGNSSVAPYVTLCCGVASIIPKAQVNPQILIEKADQALYRAKLEGRNRVVRFEQPVRKTPVRTRAGGKPGRN
jgi:diguanylate cyclase (GGDEF)-like protein